MGFSSVFCGLHTEWGVLVASSATEIRQGRVGKNESLFREVNERVEGIAARVGIDQRLDLVCECADLRCTRTIEMNVDEYEALRAAPEQFAVVPGHERLGIEQIVERTSRYVIVAKMGIAKRVATELDPRDASA